MDVTILFIPNAKTFHRPNGTELYLIKLGQYLTQLTYLCSNIMVKFCTPWMQMARVSESLKYSYPTHYVLQSYFCTGDNKSLFSLFLNV